MRADLERNLRELLQHSAERSAADPAAQPLEDLVTGEDQVAAAWGVIMLRLRAGSEAMALQATFLRQLVDEGDLAGAMDCAHFMSSLSYGFYEAARTVFASFLPRYLP